MTDLIPQEWKVEDLTPEGILGTQKTRYTSGDWTVTVENAVVWKPTYTITIEKGETVWTGKVDQSGEVTPRETLSRCQGSSIHPTLRARCASTT